MNTNKKLLTRIKPISVAIAIAISPATVLSAPGDINLNFGNSTATLVNGVDFNFACNTSDMPAGKEFRMCDPAGNLGGGIPSKKDSINGTETWSFDSASGEMTGVTNTITTGGISGSVLAYIDSGYIGPTADRDGGLAIDQGAGFFGNTFGFLAPFVGSDTVTAGSPHANDAGYGVTTISFDVVNDEISVFFPVLESQWAGTHFPIGMVGGRGVTLKGPVTNIIADSDGFGNSSFDYKISGEATIDKGEDPGSAGFVGWSPAWIMVGSGTAPDAIFAIRPNSPTANVVGGGAAAIGFTIGGPGDSEQGNIFADGRITLAESEAAFGVDTGAGLAQGAVFSNPCNGSCFDFTVTELTGAPGETVQVVLPMSSPIPANAIYRKYNATDGWHTFNTSGGDTVESGLGTGNPVDCSAVVLNPGLTGGDNCVRLTILNGGLNDNDGALDTTLVDPGGVASAFVPVDDIIPGQSIDDAQGCSVSSKPVSPLERADWWVIAAFLTLLGFRKYRQEKT